MQVVFFFFVFVFVFVFIFLFFFGGGGGEGRPEAGVRTLQENETCLVVLLCVSGSVNC